LLEAWPREASADGETVRVELPSCATLCFDALDFVRLVSLELRADGRVVLDSSSSELADSQVTLAVELCATDEYEVQVTIISRGPDVRASNIGTRLSLYDVPVESRGRTLAVGIAELLRVARRPLAAANSPATAADPAVLEAETVDAPLPHGLDDAARASPPRTAWSLEAIASARGLAGEMPAFLGGGFGLRLRTGPDWSWRLGAELEHSSGRVRWGRLQATAVSASLAVERALLTRPRVTLGPTARLLTVLGQGRSNLGVPEQLGVGWAATLSGRVALEADIDESFTLVLAGELGGYVRELVFTGVGTPVASFAGFTGGITVGFTYDL